MLPLLAENMPTLPYDPIAAERAAGPAGQTARIRAADAAYAADPSDRNADERVNARWCAVRFAAERAGRTDGYRLASNACAFDYEGLMGLASADAADAYVASL